MSTREKGGLNIDRIRNTKLTLSVEISAYSPWLGVPGVRLHRRVMVRGRSPYASRIALLPPSFYFTFTFTPFVSFHQLAHWIWVIRFTEAEAEAERPLSGHPGHPTRPTAP